ncbi:MAG: PSD1 domain-containing protein [Planctomycetia bacterium]|nr:PSD1 domain-containing protein [Planctomycetia bacterium]
MRATGFALCLLMGTAAASGTAAESARQPAFETDVLPILNAHCLQCHGGVHQRNGLDLRTLATLLEGGRSGAAIIPGKPEESLLWKKLSTDVMPQTDNKVSVANKAIIRAWIAAGAKGVERKPDQSVTRAALKPAEAAALIDREIADRLTAAKVPTSPRARDAEFLRRVYLDIAGKPPSGVAAEKFLADGDPSKRTKLIDALLASDDFGRHFAERWVNLFYLATVNQRPPDSGPFVEWLGKELNAGKPWDEVVRGILTAAGPISEAPQGLFFYYNGDMNGQFTPKILAGNIGQVLLGVQLQCAECHHHPFSPWKQGDFWSLAAFFGQTARMEKVENKMTKGVEERHLIPPKPNKQPTVLKEISITIPNDGEARNGGKKIPAGFLDGSKAELDPSQGHRQPFAAWLTGKDNRMFARAAVNRFWAHFFARGFVNPLNDFGDHNAPSHPALLEALTDEFIASGFDLKHLVRCMCNSEAYQRTSGVAPGNEKPEAEALFARMPAKVLTPEQLYDTLCVALEVPEIAPPADPNKKPNPKAPPPPSPRSVFVAAFRGPGEADEPTELKLGVPHALKLMNQPNFNTGGKLVERLAQDDRPAAEVIDRLFLAVLSRQPTAEERAKFTGFVARQASLREGYARVVWVLINSSEFMLNH